MSDLVEFLRARLAEDEQAARAAGAMGDEWDDGLPDDTVIRNYHSSVFDARESVNAVHVARHDPARVLAEVEAKRRIIDLHKPVTLHRMRDGQLQEIIACEYDTDPDGAGWTEFPCETLRLLALPYDQHPDYDEAWRP